MIRTALKYLNKKTYKKRSNTNKKIEYIQKGKNQIFFYYKYS